MHNMLLIGAVTSATTVGNWPIIKQIAMLFGFLMSGIFEMLSSMNIYSVVACIAVFTLIARFALLPLQIKQQKSARVTSAAQPEMIKIQRKYAGRRDQQSLLNMQQEQKEVQKKYGVSSSTGCIISVIQLPIMFSLYPVVYSMESYVPKIADIMNSNPDLYNQMYMFLGIDLHERPALMSLSILIPILAGLFQFLSTRMTMKSQQMGNVSPAQSQMAVMSFIMPIVSIIFCFSFPAFIGIYWCIQSLVMLLLQVIINRILNRYTVDELVAQSKAKMEKKLERKRRKREKNLNAKANVRAKNIDSAQEAPKQRTISQKAGAPPSHAKGPSGGDLNKDYRKKGRPLDNLEKNEDGVKVTKGMSLSEKARLMNGSNDARRK